MTLSHWDTVELIFWPHHFALDWTDREKQTRGIRQYSPLMCIFQRTVMANCIALMCSTPDQRSKSPICLLEGIESCLSRKKSEDSKSLFIRTYIQLLHHFTSLSFYTTAFFTYYSTPKPDWLLDSIFAQFRSLQPLLFRLTSGN